MKLIFGIILCLVISIPSYFLGNLVPIIGGPVFAIFLGMILMPITKKTSLFNEGANFCSKKILQLAVILLGFSLSINTIFKSSIESMPIIVSTIFISLFVAFIMLKHLKIDTNSAILIGVGSSICGGSAIAATAPALDAKDSEIANSISVIFLFNILAALIFPQIGDMLGMTEKGFAIFAGTAINDTSSVTAAASIWDASHGSNSLELATVVKLTRTLAIIPIVLFISIWKQKNNKFVKNSEKIKLYKLVPLFLVLFLIASLVVTIFKINSDGYFIRSTKISSKFFIVLAMSAIGLKTNIFSLIKTGGKSILLGLCCWASIILTSISMQLAMGSF